MGLGHVGIVFTYSIAPELAWTHTNAVLSSLPSLTCHLRVFELHALGGAPRVPPVLGFRAIMVRELEEPSKT